MVQVHGLVMFDEKEEEALQFSHTVMRYTILSYVLAVKRISTVNNQIRTEKERLSGIVL